MATNEAKKQHNEWDSEDLLALSGAVRLTSNRAHAIFMDANMLSNELANLAGVPREVAADKMGPLVDDLLNLAQRVQELAGISAAQSILAKAGK